jgi:hypothetical protein
MHQVQLALSTREAISAVAADLTPAGRLDFGLVSKTVMTGAFSGSVIRPYAITNTRGGVISIRGLSEFDADGLRDRLSLAPPIHQAAVEIQATAPLPMFREEQTLRALIRAVPLVSIDEPQPDGSTRKRHVNAVYHARMRFGEEVAANTVLGDYIRQRITGAEMTEVGILKITTETMIRRGGSGWTRREYPVIAVTGLLNVKDPELFRSTVISGIGRMRAYGYGAIQLQAA